MEGENFVVDDVRRKAPVQVEVFCMGALPRKGSSGRWVSALLDNEERKAPVNTGVSRAE